MTLVSEPLSGDAVPPARSSRGGRSARLAATIASGWLRTAITMVIGLVATPILVRYLGPDRFGAARVVEQWFAYLTFLTFGLGGAFGVLLIKAATTGTGADVPATARAAIGMLARQLWWILPAAVGLIIAFPWAFGLAADLRAEFYWAAPAILLGICLLPFGTFQSILDARQQGYWVNFGLAVQGTVIAGVGVTFAVAGFALTGQLWATAIGAVAMIAVMVYLSGATTRGFWAGAPAAVHRGDVWKLQWPLLVAGIGNQINLSSEGLLAGLLLGVGPVASLILTQRLLQLATVVASSLSGGGMWVGLVDVRRRDGAAAFGIRVVEVSKLNVGLNLLVLSPAVALNQRFVGLWVGRELYAGDAVTLASFAVFGVFNFFYLYASLLDCFGETRRRVWVSATGTLLKLALLVPFVHWLGLAGIPLSTAVGYLCTEAWFCPRAICREHGVPIRAVMGGLTRAVALGAAWAGVCYVIAHRTGYLLPGWLGMLTEAAVLETGALLVAWLLLLSETDRLAWAGRVRRWRGQMTQT